MKLKQLGHGMHKVRELAHYNQVNLARVGETWFALNYRSQCPSHLANRELRGAWARAQGLKVKDVENYVRRVRRERKAEYAKTELDEAMRLLESKGFVVTKGVI